MRSETFLGQKEALKLKILLERTKVPGSFLLYSIRRFYLMDKLQYV